MQTLERWMQTERSPLQLYGFVVLVVLLDVLIEYPIGRLIIPHLEIPANESDTIKHFAGEEWRKYYHMAWLHGLVFSSAMVLAAIEELIFRTIPLGVVVGVQRQSWIATALAIIFVGTGAIMFYDNAHVVAASGLDPKVLTIVSIILATGVLSAFFTQSLYPIVVVAITSSILFGYAHLGWWSMPLQGLGGLVFCFVYLTCGGLQGDWVKGTWYATVSHALFNFIFIELVMWQAY